MHATLALVAGRDAAAWCSSRRPTDRRATIRVAEIQRLFNDTVGFWR